MRRKYLFAATILTLLFGVFFMLKRPPTQLKVKSSLTGHPVAIKNEPFLKKKIEQLDYWKQAKISQLVFNLSDQPQRTVVAVRGSDKPGQSEVSLSYSAKRDRDVLTVTLYVNPTMFPASNKAELSRQYSQLALMAIYQMIPMKEQKNPENLKKFISDYRSDMEANRIFTIK